MIEIGVRLHGDDCIDFRVDTVQIKLSNGALEHVCLGFYAELLIFY